MSSVKYVSEELPDVAHDDIPCVQLPIQKVGVTNVTAAFQMERLGSNEIYTAVADISMYVSLVPHTKGISMSPLTLALQSKSNKIFSYKIIDEILQEIKTKTEVEATDAYFKMRFRFPVDKVSPSTRNVFPEFYKCEIEGRSVGSKSPQFYLTVEVPYMSYCPCSAKLSKHLQESEGVQGYPHAQRSLVRATVELTDKARESFHIEDLVHLLEGAINNCIPYPIIRRPDERELARIAGQNTLFCEDAARLFAKALEESKYIRDYVCVCNHYESIHTSEAVSVIYKNIPGGLR